MVECGYCLLTRYFLCGELLVLACYCRSVRVLTSCFSRLWNRLFGKQLYKLFVFKIRSLKLSTHKLFSFTLKWQGHVPSSCINLWRNLNKGCWVCWAGVRVHPAETELALGNINRAETRWAGWEDLECVWAVLGLWKVTGLVTGVTLSLETGLKIVLLALFGNGDDGRWRAASGWRQLGPVSSVSYFNSSLKRN